MVSKPTVSEEAKRAADSLKYRDFLTVMLILKNRDAFFMINWIYIHDPSVKLAGFKTSGPGPRKWCPIRDKACYGLEYFCFEHDGLWDSKNEDLIALAQRELIKIGLAREGDILDGCVVRQKKRIQFTTTTMRNMSRRFAMELDRRYPNLHLVGRTACTNTTTRITP